MLGTTLTRLLFSNGSRLGSTPNQALRLVLAALAHLTHLTPVKQMVVAVDGMVSRPQLYEHLTDPTKASGLILFIPLKLGAC